MEIVKTEDIMEKDSLSTIKVSSGIKYMEQVNVKCDISVNQAGFEFLKWENSPEIGKNTCYDTGIIIKTEVNDEVNTQEHGVNNYKYLSSIQTGDKIDSEQIVDISVREAGCVKCEINPKEAEQTTGYDTKMRIKTEIRDEADVDHEVNYELLTSIKVEDYKIEPDQECMRETITDKRCILSNKLGFDNGQYVNDMETIKHEQIVGKDDTDGIVLCTENQNAVQQCDPNSCEYEYETRVEGNVKIFKCQYCNYITKRLTSLKIHFTKKHNENAELYQCSICEYETRDKHYLLEHHKWKHDNATEIFHCKQCDFKTKAKYNLLRHQKLKHDDAAEVFHCEQCDYKTKTKNCLLQHRILKHNVAEFFHCELCNFKTKNKISLLRHHKALHGDASGIFHCKLCDFKTKYRCNILEHRALKHYDATGSFHCAQCDFETKYKYMLLKHRRSIHDNAAEIHYCD